MRKALFMAWLLASMGARVFAAPEPVGSVIFVQGTATATGADQVVRPLKLKTLVFANDRIVTGDKTKLQLMCADDSVISLGARSEMTIDEYVYDPKAKPAGNCVLKLIKGLFRVVTGAITDMNPERFKTKTKLATIGIRGCELGFQVEEGREDVFILHLPEGKSILIERSAEGGQLGQERQLELDRVLTIVKAGVAVELREGAAFRKRAITADDARMLFLGAALAPAGEGIVPADDDDSARQDNGAEAARETVDAAVVQKNETERTTLEKFTPTANVAGPRELPPVITPAEPKVILVGGTPFEDWEWAIWENGRTEYYANRVNGAAALTDLDYQRILDSGTQFYLSGRGSAGAVILQDGTRTTVEGPFDLNVYLGQTGGASWTGSFDLGNKAGAALSFEAGGPIDSARLSGTIRENQRPYMLFVNGKELGRSDVSYQRFSGRLIHPRGNADVISAGAGTYEIDHFGQAHVYGAFGASLQPNAGAARP